MSEEYERVKTETIKPSDITDSASLISRTLKLVDIAVDVVEATATEIKEIKNAAIRAIEEDSITYESFNRDYLEKIDDILGTVEDRIGAVVDRTMREEGNK